MIDLLSGSIILAAGIVAGLINAVAGAGTLITFPTLLALGYSPVVANVSNTVGLVPASIAGAYSFRRELKGQWRAVCWMATLSALGGVAGAVALLVLPAENFSTVVPFLLLVAAALSAVQPRVARWVRRRSAEAPGDTRHLTAGLIIGVFATGVYGGYFGAAQGVVLLALLGILWSTDLNRSNGAKNVLAGVANIMSAALFIASGTVDWAVALLVGVGSGVGGWLGGRVGRKLPAPVLRGILVTVALVAALVLFVT